MTCPLINGPFYVSKPPEFLGCSASEMILSLWIIFVVFENKFVTGAVDDSAETELWFPYHPDLGSSDSMSSVQYPGHKSHSISCFQNSCKLAVIISDIINQLYSRKAPSNVNAAVADIRKRLDDWRTHTPAHLKYDPDNLPVLCGPPHLLTQK